MKALEGSTRIAFLAFFASHIVFTLCIDLQALFKPWYPRLLQDLVTAYARICHDPHMSEPFELWFQSIVVFEMLFQWPFFFVAVHMFSNARLLEYPRWFQMACIIYGSHTATTLVPILPTLWFRDDNEPVPLEMRILLVMIYGPYFVFPAWIAAIAAMDDSDGDGRRIVGDENNNKKVKGR